MGLASFNRARREKERLESEQVEKQMEAAIEVVSDDLEVETVEVAEPEQEIDELGIEWDEVEPEDKKPGKKAKK